MPKHSYKHLGYNTEKNDNDPCVWTASIESELSLKSYLIYLVRHYNAKPKKESVYSGLFIVDVK